MVWYQAAFDPNAEHGKQWGVLRIHADAGLTFSESVTARVVSRWPTRHEAEGHARKEFERLAR